MLKSCGNFKWFVAILLTLLYHYFGFILISSYWKNEKTLNFTLLNQALKIVRNDRAILSRQLNDLTKRFSELQCRLNDTVLTTNTGAWCQRTYESKMHGTYYIDEPVALLMANILRGKTVASFGEGPGYYKRIIMDTGLVKSFDAYDGVHFIEETTNNYVKYLDLTISQFGLPIYDWIISLEVAEHIPATFENIFLDNIVRHAAHGIILSWSVLNQGGIGHINARPNEYVIDRLKKFGFAHNRESSYTLRQKATLAWLEEDLMVFERESWSVVSFEDT